MVYYLRLFNSQRNIFYGSATVRRMSIKRTRTAGTKHIYQRETFQYLISSVYVLSSLLLFECVVIVPLEL